MSDRATRRSLVPKTELWRTKSAPESSSNHTDRDRRTTATAQVHKTGRSVTLYTKNGADWTERFPHLTATLASLAGSAIIDAELVHADGLA